MKNRFITLDDGTRIQFQVKRNKCADDWTAFAEFKNRLFESIGQSHEEATISLEAKLNDELKEYRQDARTRINKILDSMGKSEFKIDIYKALEAICEIINEQDKKINQLENEILRTKVIN